VTSYDHLISRLEATAATDGPVLIVDIEEPFASTLAIIEAWFGADDERQQLRMVVGDQVGVLTRDAAGALSAAEDVDMADPVFSGSQRSLVPGDPQYAWRRFRCPQPGCSAGDLYAILGTRAHLLRCPAHPSVTLVPA
jgi:hypothetical protein